MVDAQAALATFLRLDVVPAIAAAEEVMDRLRDTGGAESTARRSPSAVSP
jgi:hypothetical protein